MNDENTTVVKEPEPVPPRLGLIRRMVDGVDCWVHEISHEVHSPLFHHTPPVVRPAAAPVEGELTQAPEAPPAPPAPPVEPPAPPVEPPVTEPPTT